MSSEITLKPLSRRNFLRFAALGAGAMVAVSVGGKALAQSSFVAGVTPVPAAPPTKRLTSLISSNHGHVFAVPLALLKTNGPKSYNIQGSAGHPHMIDVTKEVLAALLAKNVVEIQSTNVAGHTHIVRLTIV